jgi:hypothetical protein
VQKRLIELLGEHRPPLDQLFDSMCRLLGSQLQQEGILPKNIDGNELIGVSILDASNLNHIPFSRVRNCHTHTNIHTSRFIPEGVGPEAHYSVIIL